MSKFNVYEWNYKRRLASLNEVSDYIPEDEIDYSMYPKKYEKFVDWKSSKPRGYIRETMWSTAKEVGAQPLYGPRKIGAQRGHPQYMEVDNDIVRYLLVAFPDRNALNSYISNRGRCYWAGPVRPGSESAKQTGISKIIDHGGTIAIDVTDDI